MRKKLGALLIAAITALSASATDICRDENVFTIPSESGAGMTAGEVKRSLEAKLRNTPIDEVKPSVIKGLYEVRAKGNIFYSDGKYLLFGHIFETGGRDITQDAVDRMMAERIKDSLDLGDAIKIGGGKHELIEFTDPMCPFCRQAESMLTKKDVAGNYTRYVFLFPLPMHSKARPISVHILCSDDPETEYLKAMRGDLDGADLKSCKEGEERLDRMMKAAKRLGVNGTPTFFVDGKRLSGADPALRDLLK